MNAKGTNAGSDSYYFLRLKKIVADDFVLQELVSILVISVPKSSQWKPCEFRARCPSFIAIEQTTPTWQHFKSSRLDQIFRA